jgi:uncharacterized protein
MNIYVLKNKYCICRFDNDAVLPDWIYISAFYSITKTADEISVVVEQTDQTLNGLICSKDWRILKVEGPLDFSLSGIIAGISAILKEKKIPIFAISTYETDYFLLKQDNLSAGIKALKDKEYTIPEEKENKPV